MSPLLTAVVTAAVTTAVLAFLVPWLRQRGVLDVPGHRSSHEVPTPRGGGLAVLVGITVGYVAGGGDYWAALVLAIAAGTVGLADDTAGLSARFRLAAQVLIVGVAVPFLASGSGWAVPWQLGFGLVVLVGAVGFINAFNFMDGINGISGAQMLVAGFAWWVAGSVEAADALTLAAVVTVAGTAAFLPWNFPKALVFLGDVGSYFAGAWLAAVSVMATVAGVPVEATAAPLTLYVGDTVITLVRRIRRGEDWMSAHRDHTYQLLLRQGWSHTRTTLTTAALMGLAAIGGLASLTGSWPVRVGGWALVAGAIVSYLALPRLVRSTQVVPAS